MDTTTDGLAAIAAERFEDPREAPGASPSAYGSTIMKPVLSAAPIMLPIEKRQSERPRFAGRS